MALPLLTRKHGILYRLQNLKWAFLYVAAGAMMGWLCLTFFIAAVVKVVGWSFGEEASERVFSNPVFGLFYDNFFDFDAIVTSVIIISVGMALTIDLQKYDVDDE